MNLFEGKRIKPKKHLLDRDGAIAIVSHFCMSRLEWLIIVDDEFTCWQTPKRAEKDFEEIG